jgi:hypothetical protein
MIEDSVSGQYSIDPFGYHLQAAIVQEDSVSYQYSINLFRYGWADLQAAPVAEMVKEPGG